MWVKYKDKEAGKLDTNYYIETLVSALSLQAKGVHAEAAHQL